jgi:hypothetical protein
MEPKELKQLVRMNAREVFTLGLRLIGVVVAIYLLRAIFRDIFRFFITDWRWIRVWILIAKTVCLLVALYSVKGAAGIVMAAFGPEEKGEKKPEEAPAQPVPGLKPQPLKIPSE